MADLTPQAFVEKWEKSKLSERSASQQHFLDLCRMLDQPTPADIDPEGTFYTFEKNVRKTGGTPEEAAHRLDELRRNWLNPEGASEAELKKRTLTNLYNQPCPTWLENAHDRLDRAVFAAYGWPADLPDEEILKNLLALNLERSASL